MIIDILTGGTFDLVTLSDVVELTFKLGFDVALFVFFLNHFIDFFCSGGRYK